jgi:hypothetical protein
MVAEVGYSVVGRSRGQVTPCGVRTVHVETRSASFLVEPQNQGRQFSPIWPQNRWSRVSLFGHQNRQVRFGDLGFKITAVVSWFRPQNQAGFSLSIAPQNQQREDSTGHASRSGGLLRLEVSHARVFQSGLKIDGDATVGGACGTIADVTSGSS